MRSRCDFDLAEQRRQLGELEAASLEPGLWDDPQRAQRLMQQITVIRDRLERWETMRTQADDLSELLEMTDFGDEEMIGDLRSGANTLEATLAGMETELLLTGEYDDFGALLAIHAGTGGVDAQDWAEMLARMYLRWAERRGLKSEILDWTTGEEAGIKSATLELRGPYAYGYTRGEAGQHRLVRLSPFDSAHRRHTAFALVEVLPDVEDDNTIEIRDDDVRVDAYRASGAGGQHVNKTSSAIRITHLPTGIVVTCQDERSQLQNRESAFKILRARLLELKLREQAEERSRIKGDHVAEGWGSRSRSYVLQPYTMVTDHRSGYSSPNVQAVLDGDIDPLIDAWLHAQLEQEQGREPAAARGEDR